MRACLFTARWGLAALLVAAGWPFAAGAKPPDLPARVEIRCAPEQQNPVAVQTDEAAVPPAGWVTDRMEEKYSSSTDFVMLAMPPIRPVLPPPPRQKGAGWHGSIITTFSKLPRVVASVWDPSIAFVPFERLFGEDGWILVKVEEEGDRPEWIRGSMECSREPLGLWQEAQRRLRLASPKRGSALDGRE